MVNRAINWQLVRNGWQAGLNQDWQEEKFERETDIWILFFGYFWRNDEHKVEALLISKFVDKDANLK